MPLAPAPHCLTLESCTSGAADLGSCLTNATREGRSRRTVRLFAAMLRTERVTQQSLRSFTRWKHSDLRARAVVGKFWTKKLGCQANKLSAHHGNGHFFHPYPKHLTSAWGGGWSGFSSMSVLNIKKCVNLCFSNYSRSESGRQTRRSCPTLFPSHANNSFWHKTHVKGAGSLEGPLVSITS
jgi:hypothetical protein